jgi:GTP-binding protein
MVEFIPHPFFAQPVAFVAGATTLERIPDFALPEVVFVGRSNVGKSSMLNALLNRNSLVRTSRTPGHTRQINFFNLNEQVLLVDVPGYGYAKAAKKDVKEWQALLFAYLRARINLRRAYVLVDSRHGIKPPDVDMCKRLNDAAVSYQIVLTKCDKASAAELSITLEKVHEAIRKFPAVYPEVLTTSADKKTGIHALQQAVMDACGVS